MRMTIALSPQDQSSDSVTELTEGISARDENPSHSQAPPASSVWRLSQSQMNERACRKRKSRVCQAWTGTEQANPLCLAHLNTPSWGDVFSLEVKYQISLGSSLQISDSFIQI